MTGMGLEPKISSKITSLLRKSNFGQGWDAFVYFRPVPVKKKFRYKKIR